MFKKNIITALVFMILAGFTTGCDNTSQNTDGSDQTLDTKSATTFSLFDRSHYFIVSKSPESTTHDVRYRGAIDYRPSWFYDSSVFSAYYGGDYSSGEGFRALIVKKENTRGLKVHNVEIVYDGQKLISKFVQLGINDIVHLSKPIATAYEFDGVSNFAPTEEYSWQKGSTQSIRWARGGNCHQDGRSINVSLWLRNVNGTIVVISPMTANDGSITWRVPTNIPNVQDRDEMLWCVQIGEVPGGMPAGTIIYPKDHSLHNKYHQRTYDLTEMYSQSVYLTVKNN